MYRKIMTDKLVFQDYVTPEARSLLEQVFFVVIVRVLTPLKLLERDAEKRLADPNLIKRHPFFKSIDWEAQYNKKIPPPFIPDVVCVLKRCTHKSTDRSTADTLHEHGLIIYAERKF